MTTCSTKCLIEKLVELLNEITSIYSFMLWTLLSSLIDYPDMLIIHLVFEYSNTSNLASNLVFHIMFKILQLI